MCKHVQLAKSTCGLEPLVLQSSGPPIRDLLDPTTGELLPTSVTRACFKGNVPLLSKHNELVMCPVLRDTNCNRQCCTGRVVDAGDTTTVLLVG